MSIVYDDIPGLESAIGIFSFTLYTWGNDLDLTYNKYYAGIFSYLKMAQLDPWRGWRVVIHTNENTIRDNPESFTVFKREGAIIGTVSLKEDTYNPSPYMINGENIHTEISSINLIRISRFYPLFIQPFTKPVLIRDADTTFEEYLSALLYNKIISIQEEKYPEIFAKGANPSYSVLTSQNTYRKRKECLDELKREMEALLRDFIQKLSVWEYTFYSKLKDTNKIILSYDDYNYDYTIDKNTQYDETIKNNILKYDNVNVLVGSPTYGINYTGKDSKKVVRFLAGNVSKFGDSLPEDLWTDKLGKFIIAHIKQILKYYARGSYPREDPVAVLDEQYLTMILYARLRRDDSLRGRIGFFKLNYVSPWRMKSLYALYSKKKYSNIENQNRFLTRPWRPYRNNNDDESFAAKMAKYDADTVAYDTGREAYLRHIEPANKELYITLQNTYSRNKFPPEEKKSARAEFLKELRILDGQFTLEHPEVMMDEIFFFNPLTNNLDKQPNTMPRVYFGGTRRRARRRARKTRR